MGAISGFQKRDKDFLVVFSETESDIMKTVKVRIAVVVCSDGSWNSCGWSDGTEKELMEIACDAMPDGESRFWLEAEIPVSNVKIIAANVSVG